MWAHPFVPAALLVVFALATYYLNRRAPDAAGTRIVDGRDLARSLLATVVCVWAAGAIPSGILSLLGFPLIGAIVGGGASVSVLLFVVSQISPALKGHWLRVLYSFEEASRAAAAYMILQRIGAVFLVVVTPLVPVYIVYLAVSGKLLGLVRAFLAGSTPMQAVVVAIVLAGLSLVAWEVRSA